MSDPHGKSDDSSPMEADGPVVLVGDAEFFFPAGSWDARQRMDSALLPRDGKRSAPTIVLARSDPRDTVIAPFVLLALLLGSVCGYLVGRGSPDVSVAGQVSYACALIEKVDQSHPAPEDWGKVLEDQAYSDVAVVSGLLGGLVAFSQDREKTQQFGRVLTGLDRFDPAALTPAVAATHQTCVNR